MPFTFAVPRRAPRPARFFALLVAPVLAPLALTIAACGEADPEPSSEPSVSEAGTGADAPSVVPSGDGGTSEPLPGDAGPAPTTPAALQAWLRTRTYKAWPGESAKHKSTGPHGGDVRTYLSPDLEASLRANAAQHPVGATAVKEFISGDEVTGWAVGVKTEADSRGGAGWYWYEAFSTDENPSSTIEGQGKALCAGCHTSGGRDQVLTPFPLR